MKSILIIERPPGPAPEDIRNQWVGVAIPLHSQPEPEEEPTMLWVGSENEGGYIVRLDDAVAALQKAGREEAAEYWASLSLGTYLRFRKDLCEVVGE